ncbi:MAG: ABC-2 family transporter protein [Patescibacteria group bacterium]
MLKRLHFYWRIWLLWATNAFQATFVNRGTNAIFLIAKLARFGMSLVFLLLLRQNIDSFAQYSTDELVVFFLIYQWIDLFSQSVFRGVYKFGQLVRNGEFDFDLLKPIHPLFRALMGSPDINDVLLILPTIGVSIWILSFLEVSITLGSVLGFSVLALNGLLIATALHICVLSLAIITTDIDSMVWLYRDLSRLGQFPVTMYMELVRFSLFFLVPIGMMITIPAEVLLNIEPSQAIWVTLVIGGGFFAASIALWNWSLKRYTSASS